MSYIKTIRQTINKKMDKWEAEATALEAQLTQTKMESLEQLESGKQKLRNALNDLKSEIEATETIAKDNKTKLQGEFEHLHVQLTLGKAEAHDKFEDQKKKIKDATTAFEARIDQEVGSMDKSLSTAGEKVVSGIDELNAKLDAMKIQFELEKKEGREKFESKKDALNERIKAFKADLNAKRGMAKDKAATFESEMSAALKQTKEEFFQLFS
jgi:hypothetical protein